MDFVLNQGQASAVLLTPSIVHGIDPLPVPASRGSKGMVGLGRLELPTSRLSGVRSNQLSYRPDKRAMRPYPNVPDVRRELKAAVYKVPV
jgi:hypothetical protein